MCALKRDHDDLSQPRIAEEAAAVRQVLADIDAARMEGLYSPLHDTENSRNTNQARRDRIDADLKRFTPVSADPASVATRAEALRRQGFSLEDALHLAWAEAGGADVFLSVDDRLLRAADRSRHMLKTTVANPVDFVRRQRP